VADQTSESELLEAVEQLQRYLADQVPPLLVVDSVALLLEAPPELLATELERWAASQVQIQQRRVSLSDLLFHALKKLHHLGELSLIPDEELMPQMEKVTAALLARCPAGEREALTAILPQLTQTRTAMAATLEHIVRPARDENDHQAASPSAANGAVSEELVRGLERFSLMLSRLEAAQPSPAAAPAEAAEQAQLVAQLISAATEKAHDSAELKQYLEQMRERGFKEVRQDNLFTTLSASMPDWAVASREEAPVPATGAMETMRRLVTMEADPTESLNRLREMIEAGIEHFNAGSLARAVKIFALAEQMIAEQQVDPGMANLLRQTAHEALAPEQLRDLSKKSENHPLLGRALRFFPALRPEQLLIDLDGEPDRQRRHLLLSLLVVHGADARQATLERMAAYFEKGLDEESWKYLRNLIYLLRHIPPSPGAPDDAEIDYVARLSELDQALPMVREGLGYFGAIPHERMDKVLLVRLRELEQQLAAPAAAVHGVEDLERLLNVVAKNLVLCGSARGRRAVAVHGLREEPYLGDTFARLAELGMSDLSDLPDVIDRLLAVLSKELPSKVLGFLRKKDPSRPLHLIQALSGTSAPVVRQALAEVAEAYAGDPIGQAAAEALKRPQAPAPARAARPAEAPAPLGDTVPAAASQAAKPSLEGDLELFGLPNLLQNLAQSELTGVLTLSDKKGHAAARLTFAGGRLTACECGHLAGVEACYQLLERPFPGNFAFVDTQDQGAAGAASVDSWEVVSLLMEGMRRYDEFQRARAVVPEDACLTATGVRPTPAREESDGSFLRAVWAEIKAGATPRGCEEKIAADAYRIRVLLVHWVESGALQLAG